ncbi:MAG: response regulator [Oligoflexia bacterium]|nr:response regulator [Oligoflexia bacterium]
MRTLNVLLVDDEEGIRLGIKRVLQKFILEIPEFEEQISFEVEAVDSVSGFLSAIKDKKFDLYVLDYLLKDGNGVDLLKKINSPSPQVTIMISAHSTLSLTIEATKNGAFDFIIKPFGPSEIKAAVKRAVEYFLLLERNENFEREKKKIRFEFISVLAHELKSPINAIESYLNLMVESYLGDKLSEYANIISRSKSRIQDMRKLITDLLDLTRIEAGSRNRVIEEINLKEILSNCVESVNFQAQKRGIIIKSIVDGELLMFADKTDMEILLNNLLTNAVKYNVDNGSVDISIRRDISDSDSEKIFIECSDSGIGIAEEDQKKLFGEFSRVKNDKTRNIAGSGLGLSIVKKVLSYYDGEINLESKVNFGSKFSIVLNEIKGK